MALHDRFQAKMEHLEIFQGLVTESQGQHLEPRPDPGRDCLTFAIFARRMTPARSGAEGCAGCCEPRSSEYGTPMAVKASMWPWLEPFSGKKIEILWVVAS